MKDYTELTDAILEILRRNPLNILQLARCLNETVDHIQDALMDLERRGKVARMPLAVPWTVVK